MIRFHQFNSNNCSGDVIYETTLVAAVQNMTCLIHEVMFSRAVFTLCRLHRKTF